MWNEPRALTVTSHQMPLWPGTGRAEERGEFDNVLNLPLAPNSDGALMRKVYTERVFPKVRSFNPDLILLSAGFDAHVDDPLAELNWEVDDFVWITSEVCNWRGIAAHLEWSLYLRGIQLGCTCCMFRAHIENLIEAK